MWLFETTSVIMMITLTSPGDCERDWMVTFNDTDPCALKGSSVVFGCSYDYPSGQTVTNTFWKFKTQKEDTNFFEAQQYRERVEYLGNEKHNCTLRMNNLISSDANSYLFRFKTVNNAWSSKTSVSLTLTGNFDTRSKAHSHDSTKHFQRSLLLTQGGITVRHRTNMEPSTHHSCFLMFCIPQGTPWYQSVSLSHC
ncbi:unnamed protein product [Oncorhynchus mykiss]|uniref:B-cell receptor CD22 first Ig-like domain-containing protein n=1 Tax=Oncorhynchus mykiss TaxID=8022 RepID=A0A060XJA9_ONCMY|nr:unnamed protein product [Oncorhynchus mykiss]